jgi:hypothetical protein
LKLGFIELTKGRCAQARHATYRILAQFGAMMDISRALSLPCCRTDN